MGVMLSLIGKKELVSVDARPKSLRQNNTAEPRKHNRKHNRICVSTFPFALSLESSISCTFRNFGFLCFNCLIFI
jgi:hypothetical protein